MGSTVQLGSMFRLGCWLGAAIAFGALAPSGCSSKSAHGTPGGSAPDASSDAAQDGAADVGQAGAAGDAAPDATVDGKTDAGSCMDPSQFPGPPAGTFTVSTSCPAPTACGGALDGTWDLGSICITQSSAFDLNAIHGVCSTAQITSVPPSKMTGSLSVANGNFALELHGQATANVDFPNSCAGCQCTALQSQLAAAHLVATCNPTCNNGVCSCTIEANVDESESGTYTTNGSTLTTSGGSSFDFCASKSGVSLADTSGKLGVASFEKPPCGPEKCDGLDDDCNGLVDDNPKDCPPCLTKGVCAGFTATCNGAAGWSCKYPSSYEKVETTCDGLDNDCNGTVDDEPAADADCVAKHGNGYVCQGGKCVCATTCNGKCVDTSSDAANCGGCGKTCSGTCSAGRCLVALASGQNNPYAIAVDSSSVYWTNAGVSLSDGSVMKVPVGGGTPTTLVSSVPNPRAIAVDATSVYYWFMRNPQGVTVSSVPLGGGTPTIVSSGQGLEPSIAVAGSYLYGVTWNNYGVVLKIPIAGGSATNIALNQNQPDSVAVDATNVYWASYGASKVLKAPIGGGTVTTIAQTKTPPGLVTVDATNVYWADDPDNFGTGGILMAAPVGGGTPTTLFAGKSLYRIQSIASDGTNVYWIDSLDTVNKLPIGGGTPTTLATGQTSSAAIAVDATSVYWVSNSAIMKLTPK